MMDAARLARAVHLVAEAAGPGHWIVTGGAAPHMVTESEDGTLACDCADAVLRVDVECKHCLRVRLERADADVLAALRELVAVPKRAKRKAASR